MSPTISSAGACSCSDGAAAAPSIAQLRRCRPPSAALMKDCGSCITPHMHAGLCRPRYPCRAHTYDAVRFLPDALPDQHMLMEASAKAESKRDCAATVQSSDTTSLHPIGRSPVTEPILNPLERFVYDICALQAGVRERALKNVQDFCRALYTVTAGTPPPCHTRPHISKALTTAALSAVWHNCTLLTRHCAKLAPALAWKSWTSFTWWYPSAPLCCGSPSHHRQHSTHKPLQACQPARPPMQARIDCSKKDG